MANHATPTPWKRDKAHLFATYKGAPVVVATFHSEPDAELALQAVNAHTALVEALTLAQETLYKMPALGKREIDLRVRANEQINAALALANSQG